MKKKGGLYDYLQTTGVLNSGSAADIHTAKAQYWKAYKAAWRKKQRSSTDAVAITLNASESTVICKAAKKHKRSKAAFVKAATLAYVHSQFVVPDSMAIRAIRELLTMNYSLLRQLLDESLVTYTIGATVLQQMSILEEKVLHELTCPATIEEVVMRTITERPEFKKILINMLMHPP